MQGKILGGFRIRVDVGKTRVLNKGTLLWMFIGVDNIKRKRNRRKKGRESKKYDQSGVIL